MTKKALFVNVFKTASAEWTIRQKFFYEIYETVAPWCVENKTISVY